MVHKNKDKLTKESNNKIIKHVVDRKDEFQCLKSIISSDARTKKRDNKEDSLG